MKTIALALLASVSLFAFACTAPAADDAASTEAAYSFSDPPRTVTIDAASVHVECTVAHGSFVVLTFEDRIFTGTGKEDIAICSALRQELADREAPVSASLVEEHGAINRGTLTLEIGSWELSSWGN